MYVYTLLRNTFVIYSNNVYVYMYIVYVYTLLLGELGLVVYATILEFLRNGNNSWCSFALINDK